MKIFISKVQKKLFYELQIFLRKHGYDLQRYKFSKYQKSLITLNPTHNKPVGRVLLGYTIDPFLVKNPQEISNAHTHDWETVLMADTFLDLGYTVDVISYLNETFIPKKKYDYFIATRNNFDWISRFLNKDCVKIVHLDMAHWLFNNTAALNRSLELQKRRGITLKSAKIKEENYAIEKADYATVLGNEFTIGTYRYANKPIFKLPVPSCRLYEWNENKDFTNCRKNYLWFGSVGLIHKGLDLVLEAFSQMPDYHLTVCAPLDKESGFERFYRKELYETPNIHTVGWIDIDSSKFIEITKNCLGIVYPSASEGQSGAVVTCMQAGLIPIISYESGVDVQDFGVILENHSIEEIRRTVQFISNLPADRLKVMSRKAWEYARNNHSQQNYSKMFKEIISNIIKMKINE